MLLLIMCLFRAALCAVDWLRVLAHCPFPFLPSLPVILLCSRILFILYLIIPLYTCSTVYHFYHLFCFMPFCLHTCLPGLCCGCGCLDVSVHSTIVLLPHSHYTTAIMFYPSACLFICLCTIVVFTPFFLLHISLILHSYYILCHCVVILFSLFIPVFYHNLPFSSLRSFWFNCGSRMDAVAAPHTCWFLVAGFFGSADSVLFCHCSRFTFHTPLLDTQRMVCVRYADAPQFSVRACRYMIYAAPDYWFVSTMHVRLRRLPGSMTTAIVLQFPAGLTFRSVRTAHARQFVERLLPDTRLHFPAAGYHILRLRQFCDCDSLHLTRGCYCTVSLGYRLSGSAHAVFCRSSFATAPARSRSCSVYAILHALNCFSRTTSRLAF